MVVPLEIQNFKINGDVYTYSGIKGISQIIDDLTLSINSGSENSVVNNISQYIDLPYEISFTTEKALQHIKEQEEIYWPDYKESAMQSDEEIVKELENEGALTLNDDGNYVYCPR